MEGEPQGEAAGNSGKKQQKAGGMGLVRAFPQHSGDQVGTVLSTMLGTTLGTPLGAVLGTMLGTVLGPGVQQEQTWPRACRLWWGLQTRVQMTIKDP